MTPAPPRRHRLRSRSARIDGLLTCQSEVRIHSRVIQPKGADMHLRLARVLVALLLVPAALLAADAKKQLPSKQYTLKQFMNTIAVGGFSFSPDEKEILFHSDQTGIRNVYSIPVAGGAAKAMTTSTTDTTSAVSYFPHDTRFLYTRDQKDRKSVV